MYLVAVGWIPLTYVCLATSCQLSKASEVVVETHLG